MSEEKLVCIFDESEKCPVRKANDWISLMGNFQLLLQACPLCPIHEKLMLPYYEEGDEE